MKDRIVLLFGALVTLVHCGGQTIAGSSDVGPDASASSGGGSSSGASSSGGSSSGGCLGLTTFGGGPRGTPTVHRVQATACAPNRGGGVVDGGGQACTTNADCAGDGSFNPYSSCLRGYCEIDQCLSDSDCPATQVCSCSSAVLRRQLQLSPEPLRPGQLPCRLGLRSGRLLLADSRLLRRGRGLLLSQADRPVRGTGDGLR